MREFYIVSYHDIFVDDFKKCENLNSVNNYTLEGVTITANTPLEAVKIYLLDYVYINVKDEQLEVAEDSTNILNTTFLCGNDNYPASESKIDLWRLGKKTLYSNHVTIEVKELIPVMIY